MKLKEYTEEELQEYSKEELIEKVINSIWIINELDQQLEEYKEWFKYQKRCKNYYLAIVGYYNDKTDRLPKPEDFWLKVDKNHKYQMIEDSRD